MDEMQRDFYTKSEVDEKFGISPGIDNGLDFYTKSEIIANVGTPETLVLPVGMLDFYTKTEIDSIPTEPDYYDTDKATVILLDANLQRTETIEQFSIANVNPLTHVRTFLQNNPSNNYDVVLGKDFMSGFTSTGVIQGFGLRRHTNLIRMEIYCENTGAGTTFVQSIGGNFFEDCTGLKSVVLPPSLREIGSRTFYNCTSLTEIEIPSLVETIANNAFTFCSSLQRITIHKEADSISGEPWTYDTRTQTYDPGYIPITWTG